ncbi:MAG: adenosylhomocysteinase, partial [Euryarchaeota archaeon]|nr:adenosylhomocysteinase [Euryarchaeota archaeon]
MDELLQKGIRRLEWARAHMDVLADVRERLNREQTLKGLRISMALHVEAKTGMLALTLKEAGAQVRLASCNPLSTDDSVSLALNDHYGLETYAKKGESNEEYYSNLNAVLDMKPDFVIDDGADLITLLHTTRQDALSNVKGGNEETTTGVMRLRAMAEEGMLHFPVISVNDAHMKYLFDNRYGTGQSTFDGFMNSTNLLVAGKRLVVAGYGWCGKGIAMRAKGMGANVIITEVDPIRAIEAKMDGFEVMPMINAAPIADIMITATGNKDILRKEHMEVLKDGCV